VLTDVEQAPPSHIRPTLLSASLEARVPADEFKIAEDSELLQQSREKLAKTLDKFEAVELALGGGDLVVAFDNPVQAVACAVAMQSIIDEAMSEISPSSQFALNVGIHHTDKEPDSDWMHGTGLRVASSLRKVARGEVLISTAVYALVREQSGLRFVDRGSQVISDEPRPYTAYSVYGTAGGAELLGGVARALYALGGQSVYRLVPIALLVAAVALAVMNPGLLEQGLEFTVGGRPIESIAVLPFDGTSLGAESQQYGDVIHLRLTQSLMGYEGIAVFSPSGETGVVEYEDERLQKFRRRIAADGMLVGETKSAGSWLLVHAEVLRVSDGDELWSRSYYRRVGDIDSIVDEMITDIANALHLRVDSKGRKASAIGGTRTAKTLPRAKVEEVREELEDALRELQTLSVDEGIRVTSINNLASLYYDSGRDDEAIPLYREVIAIRETSLGADHPEVAVSLNNLASVYVASGEYAQAEPLYRRSLEIRLAALGPQHPRVGNAMNNLASLLHRQGRHIEAEKLYKRALEIRALELEAQLGPESTRLTDRGARLELAGNYAAAGRNYEEALEAEKERSGPDHVRTGQLTQNLANVRRLEGRHVESISLFEAALSIFSSGAGSRHVRVGRANSALGEVHREQNRLSEAERYHEKALRAFEYSLGVDHPEVANTLGYLVAIFEQQGRGEAAGAARKRQEAIRDSYVGPVFSYVAARTSQRSVVRDRLQDDLTMPQPMHEYQLEVDLGELVAEKLSFAEGLHNLALLYIDLGRLAEAEQHMLEALEIRQSIGEGRHPEVAMSMHGLAKVYVNQERYSEALVRFKEALQIFEASLGTVHPHVARCWSDLAAAAHAAGREGDAVYAEGRARQAQEALLAQ
jgi:tetratricopeptide (TPR) repeat protein